MACYIPPWSRQRSPARQSSTRVLTDPALLSSPSASANKASSRAYQRARRPHHFRPAQRRDALHPGSQSRRDWLAALCTPSRPPPRQIRREVLAHIPRTYWQQPDLHTLIRPPHLELRLRPDRRAMLHIPCERRMEAHRPRPRPRPLRRRRGTRRAHRRTRRRSRVRPRRASAGRGNPATAALVEIEISRRRRPHRRGSTRISRTHQSESERLGTLNRHVQAVAVTQNESGWRRGRIHGVGHPNVSLANRATPSSSAACVRSVSR